MSDGSEEKASDIPVDQYEVAIFTNRFSSLRMEETMFLN